MRSSWSSLLSLLLALPLLSQGLAVNRGPSTTSTVDLGYATYQASLNTTTNVTNFLGVRYAASPTGDLRWEAPQSPSIVSGVQTVSTEPNSCYQTADSFGQAATNPFAPSSSSKRHQLETRDVAQSEDCLFLNVHVPGSVSTSSSVPVIVWIHGGGYATMDASIYDGSQLVLQADHELIAVVIQYRLGLFGFLAGSEVKSGGTLNAGLLDQQFALQWVQSHIASFGGDPTRVTIWGESAGGGSVLQHIVANNGATSPSLFRAGMTSSAFLPSQYNYSDVIPEALYSEVVSQAGCSSSSNTLSCLRGVSASTLSSVNSAIAAAALFGTYTFLPVIDGTFIKERVSLALAAKKVNGAALLSVTNAAEGVIFVDSSSDMTAAEYAQQLFPDLTSSQASSVGAAYAGLGTNIQQLEAINGESIIICPTYNALAAFSGKAWKGEFAVPPGTHASDLPYYFTGLIIPNFPLPAVVNNPSFVASFAKSFMDFALSENPNTKVDSSDVTPSWSTYSTGNTEMLFNVTSSDATDIVPIVTDAGLISRCNLWNSFSANTAQ